MPEQTEQAVRGSYRRDPAGVWRYLIGGQPVPGARDITLDERYLACERVLHGGRRWVVLDRGWLSGPRGRAELAGLAAGPRHGPGEMLVAGDVLLADPDAVVDLYAPELAADALIGMVEIAALTGTEDATVRSWLYRGVLPAPAFLVGPRPIPLWARPPIQLWAAARNRPGAPHRR